MSSPDADALDPLTAKLFKRQRKARIPPPKPLLQRPKKSKSSKKLFKMTEQDRGRIRRLKQKIWLILNRRDNMKLKLVDHTPEIAVQIGRYSSALEPEGKSS